MSRNFAALVSFIALLSGSFALGTQPVEAKAARHSLPKFRNYLVPPPPPYTPSIVPSALGITDAQGFINADDAIVKRFYGQYLFTRPQIDTAKSVKPNSYVSQDRDVEMKIRKDIDSIDSEISNIEKDIAELLNLQDTIKVESQNSSADLTSHRK